MEPIRNIMNMQRQQTTITYPIRIMGVDDHPIVLDGMRSMLQIENDMVMVGQACRAPEAIDLIPSLRPDVILMDLNLPGMNGIRATEVIRHAYPGVRVIMLTTYCSQEDV